MLSIPIHPKVNLLALPSEIRLLIFECFLIQPKPINPTLPFFVKEKLNQPNQKHEATLGLLRTYRQLYEEGSYLYFHCNTFSLFSIDCLYQFLNGIGSHQRYLLKSLIFGVCFENGRHAIDLLCQCPSLTHLEIVLSQYSYMGHALEIRGCKEVHVKNLPYPGTTFSIHKQEHVQALELLLRGELCKGERQPIPHATKYCQVIEV